MKKILLVSDTHGYIDDHMMKYVVDSDEVWHAGDIGSVEVTDTISNNKPLRAVYGNIDGTELRTSFPKDLVFVCEGIKVFMTHIGGRPGRYVKGISQQLKYVKPKIFICGHSHILKFSLTKPIKSCSSILELWGNRDFIRFGQWYGSKSLKER